MSTEVEGDSVLVDYVDYGNRERVSWEQLYQLPNELFNTPFLVSSDLLPLSAPVAISQDHLSLFPLLRLCTVNC